MNTNNSIRLTAKCQGILRLIQRVNNRMEDLKAKQRLMKENERHPLFFGRKRIGHLIEDNEEIIARLERYYSKTLIQLMDEATRQLFKAAA